MCGDHATSGIEARGTLAGSPPRDRPPDATAPFRLGLRNGLLASGLIIGTAVLLNREDFAAAGRVVRDLPAALAISALVHVPQIVFTGLAWRALVPPARPSVASMALLRWTREVANSLLPAGALIGQAAAARLLARRGVTGDVAGATATVDLTVEAISQLLFTVTGLGLLIAHDGWSVPAVAVGLVAIVGAAAMILLQRNLPLRQIEAGMARLSRRFPAIRPRWIHDFQDKVIRIHARRPALARALIYHSVAWTLGAVEIEGVLALLGHPVSFGNALIIESVAQALRNAGFFLPGAIGVQEVAIVAAAALVGVPPTSALATALVRRTREIVFGVAGLAVWRRLESSRRPEGTVA
ncbi:MAG TPA: lysylphosphatidylglycerol synthase domain-containing protein [Acetobacteraceae bacterium]|nr:lysylphosphatidylglycerol synthase domain-containing protein [Acetobacteraceae bacterium]